MNEEILKRIDALAAKLNTTAAHIFDAYVRQSRIEGITDACIFCAAVIGFFWVIRWGRCLHEQDEGYDSPILGVIAIVAIACAVVAVASGYVVPTELLNPEYFAFNRLMAVFK